MLCRYMLVVSLYLSGRVMRPFPLLLVLVLWKLLSIRLLVVVTVIVMITMLLLLLLRLLIWLAKCTGREHLIRAGTVLRDLFECTRRLIDRTRTSLNGSGSTS